MANSWWAVTPWNSHGLWERLCGDRLVMPALAQEGTSPLVRDNIASLARTLPVNAGLCLCGQPSTWVPQVSWFTGLSRF